MTPYGSKISYDTNETPITMAVDNDIVEGVERQFDENYSLPFTVASSDAGNSSVFTFDASVDAETFLRHLHTASPEHYEALTAQ